MTWTADHGQVKKETESVPMPETPPEALTAEEAAATELSAVNEPPCVTMELREPGYGHGV